MTKEKVAMANVCAIEINAINKVIFNEFSPNDLKITPDKYHKICKQLADIGRVLADSYNPLVKKS